MKTTIVSPIYNNLELCQRTIESVLKKTGGDFEYILVYNQALDSRVKPYLDSISDPRVKVIDDGINYGCHGGVNRGLKEATGDYYVKLDDDTEVVSDNWNAVLINAITEWNKNNPFNKMAYIAPDSNVKQQTHSAPIVKAGISYEVVLSGVLGFSCVLFPRSTYELFGPMESKFWGDGEVKKDSRYGGEELYYCTLAQRHRMCYGYCNDVKIHHLDNKDRDWDYICWKFYMGYLGRFSGDLAAFKLDKSAMIAAYTIWPQVISDNEEIRIKSEQRIRELMSNEGAGV